MPQFISFRTLFDVPPGSVTGASLIEPRFTRSTLVGVVAGASAVAAPPAPPAPDVISIDVDDESDELAARCSAIGGPPLRGDTAATEPPTAAAPFRAAAASLALRLSELMRSRTRGPSVMCTLTRLPLLRLLMAPDGASLAVCGAVAAASRVPGERLVFDTAVAAAPKWEQRKTSKLYYILQYNLAGF